MAITFEFVQDFRKYREYITYVTKVDEALGKLPFTYYQGDMLSCYVIEKSGDVVTITMTNNTSEAKERFIKEAQPETFENIPEGIAYMYDLDRHELIYNYDAKEPNNAWNWSTYPETFWMKNDDERYDHGLVLDTNNKLCRLYLSNKRLVSLFVGLNELDFYFPNLFAGGKAEVTIQPAGVDAVMSIFACQLGQDEPKLSDIKTAISCDMVNTGTDDYAKYNFTDLIELFEKRGNEDDLWEDNWSTVVNEAVERDAGLHRDVDSAVTTKLGQISGFNDMLLLSELSDLSVVPVTDRPVYVHMDIPIHGVNYLLIKPVQTLNIFFDDLIIKKEDILQYFENLPQDQLSFHTDYIEDTFKEIPKQNKSGIIAYDDLDDLDDLDNAGTIADSDLTLGQTRGI